MLWFHREIIRKEWSKIKSCSDIYDLRLLYRLQPVILGFKFYKHLKMGHLL